MRDYGREMVRSYERLEQLKEYWMSSVTLNAGSIPATSTMNRKRNSKIISKLTKQQITLIEDEWYAKFNKAYYKTSKIKL